MRTSVGEEMLRTPRVVGPDTTAGEMRRAFADEHINCGLVAEDGRLLAMVLREDLAGAPDDARAAGLGTLVGRTVVAGDDAQERRAWMLQQGVRRLAVVDHDNILSGLLCLKRSGKGFCSSSDVSCRAAEVEPLRAAAGGWLPPAYDVIVLTGGDARRMGGVDKTALTVGGLSIVDRIVGELIGVGARIVVGTEVRGGPVAAIASALPVLSSDLVVTLAGDLPFVGGAVPELLKALVAAPVTTEVAVLVAGGRRQYLAAAWRVAALVDRLSLLEDPEGAAVRQLYQGQVLEVEDTDGWSLDVDTPGDLDNARERAGTLSGTTR